MSQRQKKQSGPTNNININIKLKVESKGTNLMGRKISNHKQINQNTKDLGRSNISTETLNKKKLSMKDNYCKSKRSVQEFINEHTISYENNESEDEREEKKITQKPVMARNDILKQPIKRQTKRMKSKSLENLKIKYYQRSMQKSRQQFSKSKQKSNTKRKNQKLDSPKSFIRTGKEQKSLSKQYSKSKSKSMSKSRSKSKSKSKSPLQISKKKSLQIFKIHETITSREKERQKSKDRKTDRSRQKSGLTAKKHSHDLQKDRHKISANNINKKYSAQIKKQLNKRSKSSEKIKGKKSETDKKPQTKNQEQPKQGKRIQSKKKQSTKYIYHQSYLNKMVTKIQSLCRGYIARKKFQHELDEQSKHISGYQERLNKISQNWNLQSDNSIICIENESQQSVKSSLNRQPQARKEEQPPAFNPLILQQLEKLRKKIEQQEGRFKMLEQENNELKANLSKISKEPTIEVTKQQRKELLQLDTSYKVSHLRINSEQNESEKFTRANERTKILELPIAIKTQESNNEVQYVDLKKKVQMFECSPKNNDMNFKFNKNVIKKLFLKQEEKLNEKYFRKNRQYEHMLQDQIVSPKTFNIRRQQLQRKIDLEKQQALHRFKQAQKALLLVAELQQDDHTVDFHKKQNHNSNNSSLSSSKNNSPSRKALNLYINVDQIDSDTEKYHPVLANHYYRENEFQSSKEEEDLSLLYKKAMSDKLQGKKCDQYLKEEYCQEVPAKYNSPELQAQQHQEPKPETKLQQSRKVTQSKGFETNLRYIRVFYIKFCEYFRQIPIFKEQILNNISDQMTFDLQLFLKSYRASMDSGDRRELIFPYFKQLATYNLAIPVHILNSFYEQQTNPESNWFNKACLDLKELSKMEYSSQGYSFYELKQYHDLALIDAFNEALNFQRPGGSQASNIDELTHDYHAICKGKIKAKFDSDVEERIKEENFDIILGNSIGRVINNWAFNLCGFLNDSEDPDEQVEQEKLQQIRQIRLTLMLEKTLVQEQINIINMSSFNFYVKFDLELKIFDMLTQQFLKELSSIRSNRYSR